MRRRILTIAGCAFAFGVLAAAVKGPGGTDTLAEVRSAIGNVSAPWLLVGFVPGTTATRLRTGALLGLLATGAALLGFYVALSFVVRRYEAIPSPTCSERCP